MSSSEWVLKPSKTIVKILLFPNQLENPCDLENRLPGLKLITVKPEEIVRSVTECTALIGLSDGDPEAANILRVGEQLRWIHSSSA